MAKQDSRLESRMRRRCLSAALAIVLLAVFLISCGSTNPNDGRILTSITVMPATADGRSNPSGVVFTATGAFSLPPLSAPVTFTAPYTGQFVVDNPTGTTIATVVSSGSGTITVQCAAGAVGTVFVSASASANNDTGTIVSASGQFSCP